MPAWAARLCNPTVLLGIAVAGAALGSHRAAAFPLSDATNPSVVPTGTAAQADLSDATALAHQAQLLNGYTNAIGTGWNYTPSLQFQEVFNDNLFQTSSDRRWDFITIVTPGIAVYGDTPNLQVRLNYQPSLLLYARTPQENQIAQNLNAIADATLWQDHLYLDVRGVAGVGSATGLVPGLGYGANGLSATPSLQGGTPTNLTKQNSTQYTAFSVSPYFLQNFEDYGTLKIAYTASYTSSSNTTGFLPLPTGTTGPSSTETSNQELAEFTTGSYFNRITDTAQVVGNQYGGTGGSEGGYNYTATNTLGYVLTRNVTVNGTIGYEDINYGGGNPLTISDMVWAIGGTWVPNPDSTISASYGHQNGQNNANVNAYYSVTARTSIYVSYADTLGTQLQQIQNQLASADINNAGSLVNSRTNAPLFVGNNLLGTQNNVYRDKTATGGATTQWDRDTLSINLQYSEYTEVGTGATGNSSGVTGTVSWTHLLRDDLTLGVSGSSGIRWETAVNGVGTYVAFTTNLSYAISASLNASLSYAFYDVNAGNQGQSYYQDLIIASLTKQF